MKGTEQGRPGVIPPAGVSAQELADSVLIEEEKSRRRNHEE